MRWGKLGMAGLAVFLLGILTTLYGYSTSNPCFCPTYPAPCQCSGGEWSDAFFLSGLILTASGVLLLFAAQIWGETIANQPSVVETRNTALPSLSTQGMVSSPVKRIGE